ncbi:hypothetical protein [Pseudocolwellia sp. HL-MZ7]|uniref:hypothetical protein n=1 Tax=Pseudocolwellia sp. HL-MZ7 TaxID=3400627 RepID=UPI003CF4974A
MKYSLLIFIISIMFVPQEVSASDVQIETAEKAAKAISIYRESRTSDVGFAAMAALMEFAEQSDLVYLEISEENAPWISDNNIKEELRHIMLAAYVIGNVAKQIETRTKENNHCAGAIEVAMLIEQVKGLLSESQIKLAKASVEQSINIGACTAT